MIFFFHGLESNPISDKSQYLESIGDCYCPEMDYQNPELFGKILGEVMDKKPTLLVGSSMGGWFAYCISTLTGIPTLLFNPAFHSRSIEPNVLIGNKLSNHTIVFGETDSVINPNQSVMWLNENGIGSFQYHYDSHGHTTPIDIFKKWVDMYIITENK
jgi:predicted esterase YcpF (UPF0227 family)